MKLVVGLGNPGRKYAKTRHNVGWMVFDRMGLSFSEEKKFRAELAREGGALFCKPLTFMNNSGEAVRAVMDYYKIDPTDVVVVYDDLDLDLGVVRLRSGGSAAGHNGLRSLIAHLGTDRLARVRIGIAPDRAVGDTAKFVLGKFSRGQRAKLEPVLEQAVVGVKEIVEHGIDEKRHRDLLA